MSVLMLLLHRHHYGVLRDEDLAESPFIPKYKIAKKNEARRLLKDILAF